MSNNHNLAQYTKEMRKESSPSISVSPALITLLGNLLDSKNPQIKKIVKKKFEYTIKQELSKCLTAEAKLSCIEGARIAFDLPHESRSPLLRKLYNETIWKYKNEDWFKLVLDRGLVKEEESQSHQASDVNLASDAHESIVLGKGSEMTAA